MCPLLFEKSVEYSDTRFDECRTLRQQLPSFAGHDRSLGNNKTGLKWCDVDFDGEVIWIRRGVVSGRIGEVKTIYREAPLPLAPDVSEILANGGRRAPSGARTIP
jgi:hypothetical protein